MAVFAAGLALLFIASLSVFGLPGNWLIIGFAAFCHFFLGFQPGLSHWYWILAISVALLGSGVEWVVQIRLSRKYGSSRTGSAGGILGAITGALCLAPLFFGLGAFPGALLGAWTGCFLAELLRGHRAGEAAHASLGAMMGRFPGTVLKLTCGVIITLVTLQFFWPDQSGLPCDFPWLPGVSRILNGALPLTA